MSSCFGCSWLLKPFPIDPVQVLYRLQEKRIALEKVVLQYGEAPAGIKEVFELCRGFERAYVNFVNVRWGHVVYLGACYGSGSVLASPLSGRGTKHVHGSTSPTVSRVVCVPHPGPNLEWKPHRPGGALSCHGLYLGLMLHSKQRTSRATWMSCT